MRVIVVSAVSLGAAALVCWGVRRCCASRKTRIICQVSELNTYPLKSAAAVPEAHLILDEYGPVGDRRAMIVNEDGDFQTQRQIPRLCLIRANWLTPDTLQFDAPGMQSLVVDVPSVMPATTRTVRVWDEYVTAADAGSVADEWCTKFLEKPVHLVLMGTWFERPLPEPEWTPKGYSKTQTSFADAYPLLLTSHASLNELNRRIVASGGEALPMNRFRTNVAVRGQPLRPFEEDTWKRIRIGNVEFHCVKPCSRCKIPTTDQATGERSAEPLATLETYRKPKHGGFTQEVLFGINLVHAKTSYGKAIHCGDDITVLEYKPSEFD
mmetsp:Transcript_6569/g.15192  ORF Transcript_6569/g.15192 Transcript_6569/m.15192 type:complete len:324 (-) Transcript_6569:29-1000(-)